MCGGALLPCRARRLTPPAAPAPADARLGPYCGALLCGLSELRLRDAQLELPAAALFADMSGLRRLDLEGCTALRTGSWLSRVLSAGGGGSDVVPMPPGLQELRAMRSNVFDKCALELGGATGEGRAAACASSGPLPSQDCRRSAWRAAVQCCALGKGRRAGRCGQAWGALQAALGRRAVDCV